MHDSVRTALQTETAFLAAVAANLPRAGAALVPGAPGPLTRADDTAALRALLGTSGPSTVSLDELPRNRRLIVRCYRRRRVLGGRPTGVIVATTLAPLAQLVTDPAAPLRPIELGELLDHVRALVNEPDVPHLIGVCSPGGFTDDVHRVPLELADVTLVLIAPRAAGDWEVTAVGPHVTPAQRALFDPTALARRHDDARRTAPAFAAPAPAPRVLDRIRALFSRAGREAEKIRLLTAQQSDLDQRRARCFAELVALEDREQELLAEGAAATSLATRRRLAARLAEARRAAARHHTLASLLTAQIDVIATHVHHLTLIRQGQAVTLPDSATLTHHAVQAEQLLASLRADADLATSLAAATHDAVAGPASGAADEEAAILREFAAAASPPAAADTPAPPAPTTPAVEPAPPPRADEPAGET